MNLADLFTLLFVALGGTGTFLLLPHRHGAAKPKTLHIAGAVSAGLAILGFLLSWTAPDEFLAAVFFYVFSASALVARFIDRHQSQPDLQRPLVCLRRAPRPLGFSSWPERNSSRPERSSFNAGAIIVTFLFRDHARANGRTSRL